MFCFIVIASVEAYIIVVTSRHDPKSISANAERIECRVVSARLKEQADRSLTSHGAEADSPWSQHGVSATSTDGTALISFDSFSSRPVGRPSIPVARSTVQG